MRFWRQLLLELERMDQGSESLVWMARGPSPSNVADPPSRGNWDKIEFFQPFSVRFPHCPLTGRALESLTDGCTKTGKELTT